ncbi:helix-hairpin-helix domain-containing protein [Alkalihalobacterium alkalinitrilicum]|uniref:helix-hairpin-helix domain-containing protein n=1 Tax=Alkalihalobacterium alkalinitrilicum TaxID=427920 RepID=UPI000995847A|nr:helix-hairpin-helix domain-containing protein [Alkalihalobacterium alkalinitrilicum]
MKMNPLNPLYLKGFNDGAEVGKREMKDAMVDHFIERLENLYKVPGIGEKTIQKIIKALDLPVEEVKK